MPATLLGSQKRVMAWKMSTVSSPILTVSQVAIGGAVTGVVGLRMAVRPWSAKQVP